jgi:hypothetical protein
MREAAIEKRLTRLRERQVASRAAEAAGQSPLAAARRSGGRYGRRIAAAPARNTVGPATGRTPARALRAAAPPPPARTGDAAGFDPRYPPYLPGRLGGVTDLYAKTATLTAVGASGQRQ